MIIQRKIMKCLIYFNFVIGMLIWFFISVLKFPRAIDYILDVNVFLIAIAIFLFHGQRIRYTKSFWSLFFIIVFFFVTLISWGINKHSVFHYIWGFRNNFRYFIFFVGCIMFLEMEDVNKVIGICEKMFPINLFLCTIQYFFMGKKGDYIGGMYGIMSGCNALINVYLCVIVCIIVFQMFERKKSMLHTVYVIGGSLYIAILSELKIFFIELVLIFLIAYLLTKPSIKNCLILISGIGMVIIGIAILGRIYPFFKDFFTVEGIIEYAGSAEHGYSTQFDINRLNAIERIYDYFLRGDWKKTLFGLGLGETDTSSINIFNTEFYKQNRILHYTWFSSAMMLLENGIVGLVFYGGFYISIMLSSIKGFVETKSIYYKISIVIVIICIIQFFYNCYLRVYNSCSFIFLFLAIPYIYTRENRIARN